MHISQYKHYLGFILGLFVVVVLFRFCFQFKENIQFIQSQIILFYLDVSTAHLYFSVRQRNIRTALRGQTKGQSNPASRLRRQPLADAQSKAEGKQDQRPGALPGACPRCTPSARWSQGFLTWSCSWDAAFDSQQRPGPLRIGLIPF